MSTKSNPYLITINDKELLQQTEVINENLEIVSDSIISNSISNSYILPSNSNTLYTLDTSLSDGFIKTITSSKVVAIQIRTNNGTFILGNDCNSVTLTSYNNQWFFISDVNRFLPSFESDKLIGSDSKFQGISNSISSDGNILAVGASNGVGAVLIYERNGDEWSEPIQLVGTGATGTTEQGIGISLSADGNTLAVGGPGDNSSVGATWIFDKVDGEWSQTAKLVGTGATGQGFQGYAVSLSGNVLAVGAFADNTNNGATWVFNKINDVWTQKTKLVGTGGTGISNQGKSVSLSADGNTLAIGGPSDNSNAGAVWIFKNVSDTWTQIGTKLLGTQGNRVGEDVVLSSDGNKLVAAGYNMTYIFNNDGNNIWNQQYKLLNSSYLGTATGVHINLSVSADNTLIAYGNDGDNDNIGAIWLFRQDNGGNWVEKSKLISSNIGASNQSSVSLSADGNILVIGGYTDNTDVGAVWIWR